MAQHYYDRGWTLALVARRVQVIEQWAKDQQISADRYAVYQADVTDIDSA